ncbi:MAG: hypothetical protein K0R65_1240 [Crocinitomicaceae bacterium]|jgi:hypothetical protein|nr:hypothetical protein [Crocinitomicaceae bacterium]
MDILQVIASTDVFHFFNGNEASEIPFTLAPRNQNTMWFAMIGLSVSFVLLAMSKLASTNIVFVFSRVLYKNSNVEKIVREEFALGSFSSIILLLNFIVTSTILLYLTYLHFNTGNRFELFYFLPAIPLYFFVWPLIWFNIIGYITKEQAILRANKQNTILFSQMIGVIFSLLLLIWAFNIKWSEYFIYSFIVIICLFWLYKILRGIIFSLENNVAWYYIILYFCTLEILPLVLIYSIYTNELGNFWLFV